MRALGAHAHCLPFPHRFSKLGCFGSNPAALALRGLLALPGIAGYALRLHRAIRKLSPDIIHSIGLKMHLLAAWVGGAPVIWHVQDYLSRRRGLARAIHLSGQRVCAGLASSQSIASDLAGILKAVPIETLLNGVDLQRFRPRGPKLDLDRLAGLPPACPGVVRIGLVGTFARWKGHEVFLRALAQPPLRDAHIRAYLVGGPIYKTPNSQWSERELRAMAQDLKVTNIVGLTGFVPDIASVMRSLDIVVHASTAPEPFGLVIAEAMACGRAVIAANSGGAAELLSNEIDGIGIPPGSPRVLAAAIFSLVSDPVKRMCLGSAARTTAEARFDRRRLGPALANFYLGALNRNARKPCESSTSIAEISTAA